MKVKIEELKKLNSIFIYLLEERGEKELDIDASYYWNIQKEEKYNPYKDPKDLDLGDLDHDMERLRDIIDGKNDPLVLEMSWLGSIYQAIGD